MPVVSFSGFAATRFPYVKMWICDHHTGACQLFYVAYEDLSQLFHLYLILKRTDLSKILWVRQLQLFLCYQLLPCHNFIVCMENFIWFSTNSQVASSWKWLNVSCDQKYSNACTWTSIQFHVFSLCDDSIAYHCMMISILVPAFFDQWPFTFCLTSYWHRTFISFVSNDSMVWNECQSVLNPHHMSIQEGQWPWYGFIWIDLWPQEFQGTVVIVKMIILPLCEEYWGFDATMSYQQQSNGLKNLMLTSFCSGSNFVPSLFSPLHFSSLSITVYACSTCVCCFWAQIYFCTFLLKLCSTKCLLSSHVLIPCVILANAASFNVWWCL